MFDSDALIHDIVSLLIGNKSSKRSMNIVKLHTGNQLAIQGDLSFPVLAKQWAHAVDITVTEPGATIFTQFLDGTPDECLKKLVDRLQPIISRMTIHQNRVLVFLDRCRVFASIDAVLTDDENCGPVEKVNLSSIEIHDEWEDVDDSKMLERNVSDYRCRLVRDVLRNLIGQQSTERSDDDVTMREKAPGIRRRWLVTNKSNGGISKEKSSEIDGETVIFCGVLRGAGQTGKKKTDISTVQYIK